MTQTTNKDYLELITKLVEDQYDCQEDDMVKEPVWISAISEVKERMDKIKKIEVTSLSNDVTNMKRDQIIKIIMSLGNLKVHNFTIKVSRYYQPKNDLPIEFTIRIWEKKFKTPSGNPCNMDYPLWMNTDNRFNDFKWKKRFNSSGMAIGISIDVIVDTVRWLQSIHKLAAFI